MRRSRGFTILEVLITTTLLALVMVVVVASLRTFGNTRSTLEQVTLRIDELRSVSSFLRNSIGGALPLVRPEFANTDDEYDPAAILFGGDESQMTWVAPMTAGVRFGGVQISQLIYEQKKLILRWYPYRLNGSGEEEPQLPQKILLAPVEEFAIGYLPEFGGDWQEEWEPTERIPAAVRFNIRHSGKYLPEIIIAPQRPAVR